MENRWERSIACVVAKGVRFHPADRTDMGQAASILSPKHPQMWAGTPILGRLLLWGGSLTVCVMCVWLLGHGGGEGACPLPFVSDHVCLRQMLVNLSAEGTRTAALFG